MEGGNARSATSSSGSKTCTDRAQSMLEPAGICPPSWAPCSSAPREPGRTHGRGVRGSQPAGLGCGRQPSEPPRCATGSPWLDAAAQGQLGSCLSSSVSLLELGKRVPRRGWRLARPGCGQGSRMQRSSARSPPGHRQRGPRRPAFVCLRCPGHALARPAGSGNALAARKAASGLQLLPARGLGASHLIPRNLWQRGPLQHCHAAEAVGIRRGPVRHGQGDPEVGALPSAPLCPFPPRSPGARTLEVGRSRSTYHGEGFPGLLQQRLREQGDVHALRDVHRPAVQVCDNNIQLQGGTGVRRGQAGALPPPPAADGELTGEGARPRGGPWGTPACLLSVFCNLRALWPSAAISPHPLSLHPDTSNTTAATGSHHCLQWRHPAAWSPRQWHPQNRGQARSEGAAGEASWQKRDEEGRSPAREAGSPIAALRHQTPQLGETSHGEQTPMPAPACTPPRLTQTALLSLFRRLHKSLFQFGSGSLCFGLIQLLH